MMPSIIFRILFAITSLAPAGLFYAFASYHDPSAHPKLWIVLLAVSLIVIVLFFILLAQIQWTGEQSSFTYSSAEPTNQEIIPYLLVYFSPLITSNIEAINWQVWSLIIIIIAMIVSGTNSYFYNSLMKLFGWNFYKIGCGNGIPRILISKKILKSSSGTVTIIELSNTILLEHEGD